MYKRQGYDIRIFDPGVRVAKLVGSNLAYVDTHLPHLAKLLVNNFDELAEHSEYLILGTDVANELKVPLKLLDNTLDLRRDLVIGTPAMVAG